MLTGVVWVRLCARARGPRLRRDSTPSSSPFTILPFSFPPPQQNSYMGKGVTKAVDNLNKLIAPALVVRFG